MLGSKEKKKKEHNSLVELVTIVAVALGLALGIQAFLVKPFVFKPPAGEPSTCGVERPSDQPCPEGTPEKSDTNFIKRVVGVPGDHLKVIEGSVYINGKRQDEPFARLDPECATCNLPREITIPKGEYYMMGDNRGESADSREWGPVPKKWIIGKAFMTYWPPNRIGLL